MYNLFLMFKLQDLNLVESKMNMIMKSVGTLSSSQLDLARYFSLVSTLSSSQLDLARYFSLVSTLSSSQLDLARYFSLVTFLWNLNTLHVVHIMRLIDIL